MKHKHTKQTLLKRLQRFTLEQKRLPNTHRAKLQLIRVGLLENCCSECKLVTWNNKKISLHLDHIDGNAANNSISNLRLLCPNCHSQTDTYCGKNKKTNSRKYIKAKCKTCDKTLSTTWATRCISCYNKQRVTRTKIEWPDRKELVVLLKNRTSMEALAGHLGVSSNALRKRCHKLDIDWHM